MKIVLTLILTIFVTTCLSDEFTERMDLSDEDRRMLNNYQSETYNQQALEELCNVDMDDDGNIDNPNIDTRSTGEKFTDSVGLTDDGDQNQKRSRVTDLSDACKGRSVKTFGIDEQAISSISKAYSQFALLSSMGGSAGLSGSLPQGGASGAAAPANAQPNAGGTNQGKSDFDYCAVIGAGTEQVSGYQQQQFQEHLSGIPTSAENAQTDGLIKVKRQYREKAKNQELNSIGWSGTSVCYVGRVASGSAALDLKTGIKMGASALLGIYNGFAAKNHRHLADELNVVIQKMPKSGDCNPITENHCFCNLPENKNNEKYCLPKQRSQAFRQYGTQVACLDKFGRPDANCNCISRNNCFDVTFMNTIDGISFGKTADEANKKIVSQLSRGILGQSNRLESGDLSNRAIAKLKGALRQIADKKIEGAPPLNSKQKTEARAFHKLGLPKNLAVALAAAPPPSKSALAQTRSRFLPSRISKPRTKSRTQSFNRASNFSMTKGSKNSSNSSRFDIKSMMKKRMGAGSSKANGKVERYADKARAQASISKRSDLNIFKIISRRYQLSQQERLK